VHAYSVAYSEFAVLIFNWIPWHSWAASRSFSKCRSKQAEIESTRRIRNIGFQVRRSLDWFSSDSDTDSDSDSDFSPAMQRGE